MFKDFFSVLKWQKSVFSDTNFDNIFFDFYNSSTCDIQ